jgi:hypothetical protein
MNIIRFLVSAFLLLNITAAHGQISVNISTPEKINTGEWNEVIVQLENPQKAENVTAFISLPEGIKTEAVDLAKGSFDNAFNAVRISWDRLNPGVHNLKFKIQVNEEQLKRLRLNTIVSFTQSGRMQKAESGQKIIAVN